MKKQILILMGVGALTYASANLVLLDTNAALTAPTSYNYSYRQTNVDTVSGNNWAIRNNGGSALSILPIYNGSYDGMYYSYTNTTTLIPNFTITTTFNRSTTSWTTVSTSPYTARPNNSVTAIGSNSDVSYVFNKWYFQIDNQTKNNFIFYLDISSTGAGRSLYQEFDDIVMSDGYGASNGLYGHSYFIINLIPAFTKFEIGVTGLNTANYFDAWYLRDLGTAASWTNGNTEGYTEGYNDGQLDGYTEGYGDGYDAGYSDGIALTGMGNIFELAFNTVSTIFNIQVLGTLTLGTIVIAPIAIALLWFILGIVSGVGTGGKKK